MGFGATGILWGLLLAATPLVLHLLHRQRHREMAWAAMPWLLAAIRKNYRRIRVEQFLLLAVRTLLIVAVVLAMAKPMLRTAQALFLPDTTATHHAILFDNSMSMHYALTDRSRWDEAKTLAHNVLESAAKGDLASVVVMGTPASVLVGEASPYLSAVAGEIDAIKPQHGPARLEGAIDRVAEILQRSRSARKRVYLITDMQRETWSAGESAKGGDLARKLRALGASASFSILDTSSAESPNLAVVEVAHAEPLVVRNRIARIQAEIANFSIDARENVRVELLVDGQVEATEYVSLPPRETRTVNFQFRFREAGERVVAVRIGDDALTIDNERFLSINVRDSLAVLLVDGAPSGEPFASESDYLAVALAPGESGDTPNLIRTETRLEADFLDGRLDAWDLVIIANVAQFTPSEVSVLKEYLRRGGGVLFFLGSQTNPQSYNLDLFEGGKGLLPAKLLEPIGRPRADRPVEFFHFDPGDYADPIIAPFKGAEQAGLLTTKIFRYIRLEPPADSPARVVLGYETGDPAIVLAPFERGMVGLVSTSADLDWNTWAISPSYVPIVQELAKEMVIGRVRRPSGLAGEPIRFPLPRQSFDAPVTVRGPDPELGPVQVRLEEQAGVRFADYSATDLAGVYHAQLGPPIDADWAIAVNTWPRESDLSRYVEDDLRSLLPEWEFTLTNRWAPEQTHLADALPRAGELDRPLIYLVLVLLFLETFLAWKFGHHAG